MRSLAATLTAAGMLGLTPEPQAQTEADVPEDWPTFVIVEHGGMVPGPTVPLRLVIWADGTILLPSTACEPDSPLLVGRLEAAELSAAISDVEASDFQAIERLGYVVPDAEYATVIARLNGEVCVHSWHESLSPNFGGNTNADLDYLAFVRMWRQVTSILNALTPTHVQRLKAHLAETGATTFRGYDPSQPHKTSWMRSHNWE